MPVLFQHLRASGDDNGPVMVATPNVWVRVLGPGRSFFAAACVSAALATAGAYLVAVDTAATGVALAGPVSAPDASAVTSVTSDDDDRRAVATISIGFPTALSGAGNVAVGDTIAITADGGQQPVTSQARVVDTVINGPTTVLTVTVPVMHAGVLAAAPAATLRVVTVMAPQTNP